MITTTTLPSKIDSLCEIMLGEKIASPILSRSGKLLISGATKLTRARIASLLPHLSVYLAEGFEAAESKINAILSR